MCTCRLPSHGRPGAAFAHMDIRIVLAGACMHCSTSCRVPYRRQHPPIAQVAARCMGLIALASYSTLWHFLFYPALKGRHTEPALDGTGTPLAQLAPQEEVMEHHRHRATEPHHPCWLAGELSALAATCRAVLAPSKNVIAWDPLLKTAAAPLLPADFSAAVRAAAASSLMWVLHAFSGVCISAGDS